MSEMKNTAIVTAVHRDRYELSIGSEITYGRLKTAAFYNSEEIAMFPTVGDRVEVLQNADGDSTILKVMERRSVFMRLNATQGLPDQAVAANFDYVFITMSLNKDFHPSKLERYLTVAWQSGGTPVILLTKSDLMEDRGQILAQVSALAPGVDVYCVSSYTGEGFLQLEKYFTEGHTIVLLGSSGVGKSSFVNVVMGAEQMQTAGIRESDAQGRHTTTYKQMFCIPEQILLPDKRVIKGGGRIIDTPGMRKLIIGEDAEGAERTFEDIEGLVLQCRFSDCRHQTEPGCAVKRALTDQTLDERRWKTYLSLQKEEAYARERQRILTRKIERARKRR
ncbi:MAG: ribosome small subunit-dependent GTPase A [Lachnospiraceae bacterium]|jgi:ribosome biogenesis GTPase|nr:ribosome small subunit-dependent GTPase A [Lachnospiraceae bacterium]